MKKQLKTIMIAMILGITAISASTSYAANNLPLKGDLTRNDEFTKFIKTKAAKFSKANLENFKKYNEVVDLYNSSAVAFFNLNATQRNEFTNATNALIVSLNDLNNSEASNWAKKVKLNQAVYSFIWSSKVADSTSEDLGIVVQ